MAKGKGFIQNISWNLLGAIFPLIVSIYAIPKLIAGYGDVRFGLLTLIWSIIGYFSIFDFGMGRALTKLVAERLGTEKEDELPDLTLTSVFLIGLMGIVAGIVLILSSKAILSNFLHIDGALLEESQKALQILALALPTVVLQAGIIGLLEAHNEFKAISTIRLFLGLFNFLGPVVALYWSNDLYIVTLILAAARIISTGLYLNRCFSLNILTFRNARIKFLYCKYLFRYGAWVTVSNVISPLMVQLDRFIIGSFISVSKIAYYTVPADAINKLSVAPTALISVMFPTFANVWGSSKREYGSSLFWRTSVVMLNAILPVCVIFVLFAHEGLNLWLGKTFAIESTAIVQFLAIGFLLNSLARVPHALLQSVGRPDITAKLHIIELPLYLLALWLLLSDWGVQGAAIAWSFRMFIDFFLLLYISGKTLPEVKPACNKILIVTLLAIVPIIGTMLITALTWKIIIAVLVVIISGAALFKQLLSFQSHYLKLA
ncbi:flippase [Dyadobacter fanqingshengii]|uniref:Flippase n=1 Tax=Dyadobacter fanqingshengii TaxID=2906443 RepID=A0A9X1PC62_9BACT|nr:flippase [Dyadobacter fanqingshengii]MCF0042526.1 flippase [Dyadobacter fanqingshengii]USJ36246.1 flippase [Dyadobacter fanqingshengii]